MVRTNDYGFKPDLNKRLRFSEKTVLTTLNELSTVYSLSNIMNASINHDNIPFPMY